MSANSNTTTAGANAGRAQRDLRTELDDLSARYDKLSAAYAALTIAAARKNQDLELQNSRIRRLYALLEQIDNRCRFGLEIRISNVDAREDLTFIRTQIEEQTFTIGQGCARVVRD